MSDATTTAETPAVALPSASGVVAVAGKQQLALLVDLNRDGIPDIQQGWFWNKALGWFAWAAERYAAPHTVAHRVAKEIVAVKPELKLRGLW